MSEQGDLLRDGAGVLPTGRNIHALDPFRVPSPAARARGALAALERAVREAHEEYVGFGRGWDRWMDVRAIARARVPVARRS